ncbi:hypothetical protein CSC94_11765 [Zhengella mangrovi]|uniref:HTH araC/xylS-type domain-containing protein n=2 Tax=Zhengella mangrovi TaxID=1982044 RepID=A0A2G1QNJ2_9HYPH|nr:hypothetical protein CSC94_11765 [Zhengella mangrovi]
MPLPNLPFSGELTQVLHDGARMSRIRSSAGRFQRHNETIKRDSFDGFLFTLMLRGDLRLIQNDKALLARHGEGIIYRHGAPFELEFPDQYWSVALWVPPDLMQHHCPQIAREGAVVVKPETTNGTLALSLVKELCVNAISKETSDTMRLVGATLDVLSTVSSQMLPLDGSSNRWLVDKLSRYVDRNIDDTELNLGRLVDVGGVSARTLNRAFASDGTTPMRWLWDRRLDAAYDALARTRVRNVTEAALAFGFKDGAHFSRAFSRKFGLPPSAVLKRT